MTQGPLKLLAADEQDLQVVAAILQDAILPASEMVFKPEEKRFIALLCRFRWDACACEVEDRPSRHEDESCYERIHCALEVQEVMGVQTLGLDLKNPSLMLDLLTILPEEEGLTLIFAGDGRLRLLAKDWRLKMQDFGESWPTKLKPSHPT